MSELTRNEWIISKTKSILDSKKDMLYSVVFQMLWKTTQMFKYKNLPDTILVKDLETMLQVNGFVIWKEVNDNLYVFLAGLGGEPSPYYHPTIANIANPALRYFETVKIDDDCVWMLNDYYYQGLMPLFNRYASLLVEAETSLKYAIWNARTPKIIAANNDDTYASANEFFKKVVDGKDYGVVLSREFIEQNGLKAESFYETPMIKDIVEAIQYIKGSWYNELGMQAQFNMKREVLNEAETAMNTDILFPTVDMMLKCRQDGLDRVNAMFGTNITVEFNSVWLQNQEEADLSLDIMKSEIAENKEDATIENKGNADDGAENSDT